MSDMLRAYGYEVDYAPSGLAASDYLQSYRYQTIFLDINLGLSDGLDLMPEINASQNGVRVVVVSAYGDESVREAARKAGVSDFILKPFSKSRILSSLEK